MKSKFAFAVNYCAYCFPIFNSYFSLKITLDWAARLIESGDLSCQWNHGGRAARYFKTSKYKCLTSVSKLYILNHIDKNRQTKDHRLHRPRWSNKPKQFKFKTSFSPNSANGKCRFRQQHLKITNTQSQLTLTRKCFWWCLTRTTEIRKRRTHSLPNLYN